MLNSGAPPPDRQEGAIVARPPACPPGHPSTHQPAWLPGWLRHQSVLRRLCCWLAGCLPGYLCDTKWRNLNWQLPKSPGTQTFALWMFFSLGVRVGFWAARCAVVPCE